MFAPIAEDIKRAVIGIIAAQNALRTPSPERNDHAD
jgi:hypothetical protein